MPSLKDHVAHGAVAAALAVTISAAAVNLKAPVVDKPVSVIEASKHAWPALSDDEKSALAAVLKTLPKGTAFDIICNDASCDDLAEDLDDAMEAAGLPSVLDRSLGPLGYGIGIMVNGADKATAEKAVAALRRATGGKLDPPVTIAKPGQNAPGYVTIVIGKYRAK
jgi:hypothetical protein